MELRFVRFVYRGAPVVVTTKRRNYLLLGIFIHLSSGASTMFIYYLWPVLFPIFTL